MADPGPASRNYEDEFPGTQQTDNLERLVREVLHNTPKRAVEFLIEQLQHGKMHGTSLRDSFYGILLRGCGHPLKWSVDYAEIATRCHAVNIPYHEEIDEFCKTVEYGMISLHNQVLACIVTWASSVLNEKHLINFHIEGTRLHQTVEGDEPEAGAMFIAQDEE